MKTIEFTTAHYVKIEYELAPTLLRVAASLIDLFAFFIYFIIVQFLFSVSVFNTGIDTAIFMSLLLYRLPFIFYSPIIEFLTRGQSLGKYAVGIRVVKITGENAGLRELFTRWIFRVIDMWFGFGFIAILFSSTSERGQRLGDAMAGTVVIRNKNAQRFSLKSILAIKSQENYTPTYLGVTRFTDEDVMLIKTTLQRVEKFPNEETKLFTIDLAHKTAELIGLEETPDKKIEFLRTVLLDYVVLTR